MMDRLPAVRFRGALFWSLIDRGETGPVIPGQSDSYSIEIPAASTMSRNFAFSSATNPVIFSGP